MSTEEETPPYNSIGRGIYNDVVDSTSSHVGKLLFANCEVRSSETMKDRLLLISSMIENKVLQVGAGLDTLAPHYQKYLSNAWDKESNRMSKIVTLNSLVYCDVVLGLFEQFCGLARRKQLEESGLASLNAIELNFTPLLSLVIYILVAVAMGTPDDNAVRRMFEVLPLDRTMSLLSDDGFRPTELPPLLSWINGTPGNNRTKGVPTEGALAEEPDLDIDYTVKWSYIVALLTGYYQRSGKPNRCFRSGYDYFCVPKVPELVGMLDKITRARIADQTRYQAQTTADLYKTIMSPRNIFASPVVLAEAYGHTVFRKLNAMASEGFFDELACVKVPDGFTGDSEVFSGWPTRPRFKMWKFEPEDGIPFYLIVGEMIFSPRFHQWREYCANTRPVIPSGGGSRGGFTSVSVRGARTGDDVCTFDEQLKDTYFPVGSGRGRALLLYGACPQIQPDDEALFKITDLIYNACEEGVSEYLDGNSMEAKRFPTGKANIISTFYASGNNIGQGSHSDFNLTIARENTEIFDEVPLPTREELFTLTYVGVQSRYVLDSRSHTTYEYTVSHNGTKTKLSPVKNVPNCENGPVVITGNAFTLQCGGSQAAEHAVGSSLPTNELPLDIKRSAATCRSQAMPQAIMKKLKGHSVYRLLPPSFEERMDKWRRNQAGFEVEKHWGYDTFECGNTEALVSADPRAAKSGRHLDYFSQQTRFASFANTTCEEQVPESPISPPQLLEAWKNVVADKLPRAPDPFCYDKDITRQEFFVDSEFPASIGMLHHTVVRNLLLRERTNVFFECLPPRLRDAESLPSDEEETHGMDSHQKQVSSHLYMPSEKCFAKPGEIYSKKAICLAAGMPDKPGLRSHPILSCIPHKPAIMILRNGYKSTSSVKTMVMNSLKMRAEGWLGLSVQRLDDDGITYGSGGSSLPSGSQQCDVADLALDVHNIEAALRLTLGQDRFSKINAELHDLMLFGYPISLFVTLGEFFSEDDLKEIYDVLQVICARKKDETLSDWKEFLSSAGERTVFVDYIYLKEVRSQQGDDPTECEDLSQVTPRDQQKATVTPQEGDEQATKLHSDCIVSPGTEKDHEKHGVLVDYKNNYHISLLMSRMFSPAETQKLISMSGTSLQEVRVDKDDLTPLKIPVTFEIASNINRRKATFSIHSMRRYLFTEGYKKFLFDNVGKDRERDDENSDGESVAAEEDRDVDSEAEEERVEDGSSNNNKDMGVEDQTRDRPDLPEDPDPKGVIPLKEAIHEVIFSCAMTVQAGCLRALGQSVVKQRVKLGGKNHIYRLSSSTLSSSHIVDACRLHPLPMAARYLDVGPLCSIAHSISFGGMKDTSSIFFEPLADPVPKFIRTPVNESTLESLCSGDIATLITNACINRLTGRPNYLMGYAKMGPVDGEQLQAANVLAGLLLASSQADRDRFVKYIEAISTTNRRGHLTIGHLFTKQLRGQIPKFLWESTANFVDALVNGIFDFGNEFLRNYHAIVNEVKSSMKEGEEVKADYFHKVQTKVFQWIVSYLHTRCDGNSRTKEKDWHFVAQALLLDIRGAILFPSLETHYLVAIPITGEVGKNQHSNTSNNHYQRLSLCGNTDEDPNKTCSNPATISTANGSNAVLKLLRARTGRPKLSMDDAFVLTVDVLRKMKTCELVSIGLVPFKFGSTKVLIDALTGQVWCRLGFEHWLCKHYLVLKHKFPQNSSSETPETDKTYLHPCVFGKNKALLRILDWDQHVSQFLPLATEIVTIGRASIMEELALRNNGPITRIIFPNVVWSNDNRELALYDAYPIACRKAEKTQKEYWNQRCSSILEQKHKKVILKKRGAKEWSLAREGLDAEAFSDSSMEDYDQEESDIDVNPKAKLFSSSSSKVSSASPSRSRCATLPKRNRVTCDSSDSESSWRPKPRSKRPGKRSKTQGT